MRKTPKEWNPRRSTPRSQQKCCPISEQKRPRRASQAQIEADFGMKRRSVSQSTRTNLDLGMEEKASLALHESMDVSPITFTKALATAAPLRARVSIPRNPGRIHPRRSVAGRQKTMGEFADNYRLLAHNCFVVSFTTYAGRSEIAAAGARVFSIQVLTELRVGPILFTLFAKRVGYHRCPADRK
jgi:hypothetical protein